MDHLYNAQLAKGRSVKSKDSSKGSAEKESLALLQNESTAKGNVTLLEVCQKL